MKHKHAKPQTSRAIRSTGFTLTELVTSIAIVGTLSAISIPNYIKQISRGCQSEPESIINQVMMQAQAHNDEFGTPATGWSDLDKITTLMTAEGPALGATFQPIPLQTCDYNLWGKQAGNDYLFIATKKNVLGIPTPIAPFKPQDDENDDLTVEPSNSGDDFNVLGCLNVATGASDIKRGNGSELAYVDDLTCPKQW